ncbi:MAG: prepilin-type N-terminal cleavage/methylation domain-containing protein [Longimicrobiales bacterium]
MMDPRRGFTLVELTISLTVFGVILAGALGFMTVQNKAFNLGSDRMLVVQNLRFVVQQLEIDLQALGSNVPDGQPRMVYAGADVVSFSGDHTSNLLNDVSAIYVDVDAPNGYVQAPRLPGTIAGTGSSWPDTIYRAPGGSLSPAELITLYFEADTSTARSDDFVLKRKVNFRPEEVVARNLLQQSGIPFFRYFRQRNFTSKMSILDSIPDGQLPRFHSAPTHGSAADTGSSASADSIRALRVSYRVTNGRSGDAERFADVSRVIHLPNAGFGALRACGDGPILGVTLAVSVVINPPADTVVNLRWDPAVDEVGGEQDVIRYVIFRKFDSDPDWGDPYLSIPAGGVNYTYDDADVQAGLTYDYALAAQDCTPLISGLSPSSQITVN